MSARLDHIPLQREWARLALGPYTVAAVVAALLVLRWRTRLAQRPLAARATLAVAVLLAVLVVPLVLEIAGRARRRPAARAIGDLPHRAGRPRAAAWSRPLQRLVRLRVAAHLSGRGLAAHPLPSRDLRLRAAARPAGSRPADRRQGRVHGGLAGGGAAGAAAQRHLRRAPPAGAAGAAGAAPAPGRRRAGGRAGRRGQADRVAGAPVPRAGRRRP